MRRRPRRVAAASLLSDRTSAISGRHRTKISAREQHSMGLHSAGGYQGALNAVWHAAQIPRAGASANCRRPHRGRSLEVSMNVVERRSRGSRDQLGQITLLLQGGGALGAYQGGVYEALHERGLEPDWIIGTSIGAINAALIAGNAPP